MSGAQLLIGVLAIIVAPSLTYFGLVRRLSGRVATSESAQLWKESAAIRAEQREQAKEADTRIAALEAGIEITREELRTCKQVLYEMKYKIEGLGARP